MRKEYSEFDKLAMVDGSSHPSQLIKQRKKFLLLGFVPILVLAVVGIIAAYSIDSWNFFLTHKNIRSILIVVAVGLSMGAMTTAFLINMIELRGRPGEIRDDCVNFPGWIVWCGLLSFAFPIGFDFIAQHFKFISYTGSIRFVIYMSAFMPFVLLMAYMAFSKPGAPPVNSRHDRRWGALGMMFLAMAALILLVNIRESIVGFAWPQELAFLQSSMARVVGFALLAPLAFLCYCFYRLSWVENRKDKKEKKEVGTEAKDEKKDKPPEWLTHFAEQLQATSDKVSFSGDVEKQVVEHPSPEDASPDPGLVMLMAGHKPTIDQSRYFNRYIDSYLKALKRICADGFRDDVGTKVDVLLEGPEGSGRTEMLCATALHASLARGQGVLFIVRGDPEAEAIVRRLEGILEGMCLKGCVDIRTLDGLSMSKWCSPNAKELPPSILVSTPQRVESCFFANSDAAGADSFECLKRCLLGYDEILVDDFLDMPAAIRSHLSFILDKIRLIMQSESRLAQFVIVTSPMVRPDGDDRAGDRLFRQLNFDPVNNVIRLGLRQCESPYWGGVIEVADGNPLEEAARDVLVAALQCNLKVLFYNRGISDDNGKQMEESVRSRAKEGTLDVIARLSDERVMKEPQVVFYLSITSGDCGTALRMYLDGDDPVFLKIRGKQEREEQSRDVLPLLPDESAAPLCVQHLKSVLRYVKAGVPINASTWGLLGVSPTYLPPLDSRYSNSANNAEVAWDYDFYVERIRNVYRNGELWPYFTLATNVHRGRHAGSVNLELLPDSESSLFRTDSNRVVLVDIPPEGDEAGSRRHLAVWVDDHDGEIGKSDLSRASELVLRRDGLEYVVGSVLSSDTVARQHGCAVAVRATPRHWSDEDHVHPVLSLEWNLPIDGVVADEFSQPDNFLRFVLGGEGSRSFKVNAGFSGLMNGLGKTTTFNSSRYSYRAYASCVVLNPSVTISQDGAAEQVQRCMSGTWRTDSGSGFSPALTHAITAALRQMMSGWEFFAIAPCFFIEGRDESIGQVVIWFLESESSGRTVSPMLMKILSRDSSAFKRELIELAKKELAGYPSLEKLHMASRIAFEGEALDDLDVRKALQALDVLAGECERLAPPPKSEEQRRRVRSSDYDEWQRRFDNEIADALVAFKPEIDVTEFVHHGWTTDIIEDRFEDVRWNHPEIFYVSRTGFRFQWWQDADGNITRMVIRDIDYAFSKSEYGAKKKELDAAVVKFLSDADVVSGSGAIDKILRIHDQIVKICDYDVKAANAHDRSTAARTVYSVLVRRKAVCEGYSMAFRYLLSKVNLVCEVLVSDAMHHCWNYVENDGKWYHVDVTWDDPIVNGRIVSGTANLTHDHFLKSDIAIRELEHHGWSTRGLPPAADTQYDDRDWS